MIAALPFWYFEKNLDKTLIDEISKLSFEFEKATPSKVVGVNLIGSLKNETNDLILKETLNLFECTDCSIHYQQQYTEVSRLLNSKTLDEFYSSCSAISSGDDLRLFIFSKNQFSFEIPSFKWKKSLFYACNEFKSNELENFLTFLRQPVSPKFLDVFSKTAHLSDNMEVKITSLSIENADIDNSFMHDSVVRPLESFLSKFKSLLAPTIKIQKRMMQSFEEPPKSDEGKKIYFFDQNQSSTFLKSGSWNLDSTVRKVNHMNLLFVNTNLDHPVYFLAQDGSSLKPSICYPDWGCVLIFDKRKEKDLKEISQFLQESFGYMMGVYEYPAVLQSKDNLASWEEYMSEFVLSRNLERSVTSTMSYIDSLKNILESFTNISIAPEFQSLIHNIRETMSSCISNLKSGNFQKAVDQATTANQYSESAFFHPSLLGKLYFPDEHKYAVYLPLLLPTFLPVVLEAVKMLFEK